MRNIEIASEAGKDISDQFLNIPIGPNRIGASFWMNNDPDLKGTNLYRSVSMGGKLSPTQIAEASLSVLEQKKINPSNITATQLKILNRISAIGVDCSGFTYQVTKYIYEALGGIDYTEKVLGKDDKSGITKVNSNFISSPKNSIRIKNVTNILPGDIIRCMGGIHTLVVVSKIDKIHFLVAHSSDGVPSVGVSMFDLFIKNGESHVFDQFWTEKNKSGVYFNWRLADKFKANDGIWRLRIMQHLFEKTSVV